VSFVEPLFLAGLLAAAVPVIVHLINRRKAVQQPFPPLELLRESDQKEARSIKVRQWLLMALRILAVALLALALAKPYFLSAEAVGSGDRLPKAVVFVVDDSMSMDAGDWWERARERVDAELSALKPWDEVALLAATRVDGPVGRLENDRERVRRAFDELRPSHESAEIPKALRAAADILSTSELPNRRIVLVSDFTSGGFPAGADPEETVGFPVRNVSVRDGERPQNLAVRSVDFRQAGDPREGLWEFEGTIENFGPEAAESVEVRLSVDGEVQAGGLVDVPAGESVRHTFRHRLEGSGLRRATFELVDADSMAVDDRRLFVFRARAEVDALLVNGAPSSVPYRDELFFTVRALNPGKNSQSEIRPNVVTASGFRDENLEAYDVVLLANVAGLSEEAAQKLESFVRNGGGLFVAMGNQVEPDAYNQQLGELLPRRLRRVKLLAEKDDPDAPVKITRFAAPERDHPVFEVFDVPGGESLQSAKVYKYMLLEPTPPEQSRLVLSYQNGAPALLERTVGEGRTFLLTTTLDRAWTDLPVRTAFLPVLRRSVLYLARGSASEGRASYRAGEPVELEVGGRIDDRAVVRGPEERRVLVPEDGRISFTPNRAGFYEIAEENGESGGADSGSEGDPVVAVNVGTSESDLSPLSDEAYAPWLDASGEEGGSGGEASEATAKKQVNLWPALLFAVTIALLLETLFGTRRSVLKKIWRNITFQSEPELEV